MPKVIKKPFARKDERLGVSMCEAILLSELVIITGISSLLLRIFFAHAPYNFP